MARSRFIVILAGLALWACSSKDEPRTAAPETGQTAAKGDDQLAADEDSKASGCLVDQGGCRPAAAAVPPCADGSSVKPVSLSALLADPRAHADKAIAVEGPLIKNGAGCTEKACELTCCNTCTSIITLGDAGSDEHVRLESAATPGLYLCRGDESLVCCQVQAGGQTVIAQGTFQIAPNTTPPVYQLWVSELCAPAPGASATSATSK
jgi:hypothetical protein